MLWKISTAVLLLYVLYIIKAETRYRKFKRNLKPGTTVVFFIGEERHRGEVLELRDMTALVKEFNKIFVVSNEDIYPDLI